MSFAQNIIVCHRCLRAPKHCSGVAACPISGNDIIEHATTGECPELRFPSRGLGDTVAKAIHIVTLGAVNPCGGCAQRQAALNAAFPFKS